MALQHSLLRRDTQFVAGTAKFCTNPTYGFDMNKDARFTGTPVVIHNGTDSSGFTGSNLTGANFVFNSTAQAYAGTHSIDGTATVEGNEALFSDGSVALSGYVALSGAVYLTSWSTQGTLKEVEVRLRFSGTDVGNSVNLSSYINKALFGVWQLFAIPFADFGASTSTINQVVVKTRDLGAGNPPDYYLDALQIEQTGGGLAYEASAAQGTIYSISGFGIGMVDTYDGTLANSPSAKATWNKFFGITKLPVGIISYTVINGIQVFTGVVQQFMDFQIYPNVKFQTGTDGTSTWYKWDVFFGDEFGGSPLVLDSRRGDKLGFLLLDDLSGLDYFRILTNGVVETLRPMGPI